MIQFSFLTLLVRLYFWFGKCHCLPTASLQGHLWNLFRIFRSPQISPVHLVTKRWDGTVLCQEGLEGKSDLDWGVSAAAGAEGCPWALSCPSHIL